MSLIIKQDTDGVKALLDTGEFGYDNYLAGGDSGRVYVGTGSSNIPLAKKQEVTDHIERVDNPHSVTKAQVGLGNVDNTSDANKPVSNATQSALNTKVGTTGNQTIDGVKTFTSSPIVPTPIADFQVATKKYVDDKTNTFENIAQLKLNSNIGRVEVLGYYTKGDGGGGTFYWDSTSTETDNGGTIIQAAGITTGRWKKITDSVASSNPYATKILHDSISGSSHSAGSSYSLSKTISGYDAWTHGLIEFDINTTTTGMIKLLINGTDIIFGDRPDGILFSSDAVLMDGIENNRILDNHTYTFPIDSMSIPITSIGLETDTSWAGTVNSIKLYKLNIKSLDISVVSNSDIGKNYATGIKGSIMARGDMAFGDSSALMSFQYDGNSPTPAYNLAVGARALSANQRGDENTAIGSMSLMCNEGSNNTAVGYSSLKINTKGQENTAVGYKSGAGNTTGYRNTYMGFWAGAKNSTGSQNTIIGWHTNASGVSKSGVTAIGSQAGGGLRGDRNVSIGALSNITDLNQETLNVENAVAVGTEAKSFSNGATAIGALSKAGSESLSTLVNPIAIGYNSSSQGDRNIAIGHDTLITGREQTVCLGALIQNAGSFNTIIGSQAGTGFNGNYNTFLGYCAGNQATNYQNSTCIGSESSVSGSHQVQLGNDQTTVYVYGTVQNRSDIRDKDEVQDSDLGLDFISKLRPVKYKFDLRDSYYEHKEDDEGNIVRIELPKDGSKKRNRYHYGLIAQELKEVSESIGIDFGGLQDHSINGGNDVMSIGYDELISPLIKAVQELKAEVDVLKNTIKTYEEFLELQRGEIENQVLLNEIQKIKDENTPKEAGAFMVANKEEV